MSDERKLPVVVAITWSGLGENETPVVVLTYRCDDPNIDALLNQGGIVAAPKVSE